LNKKAIGKDMALDQMLKPTLQGPATLKKSYITNAPNAFIPLDAMSAAAGGLKAVHQINPAIAALNQDVNDLRDQVNKLYYADYLLYLTRNPKTRTAREVDAVVQEQQLIIGPNLQSLNWTYNEPVLDFVMDYVLEEDPYLPPPPESLQGEFLRTEFISVFAQAQKAADLPSVDRYVQMIQNVGQLQPSIFDKINLDKLADLYEDRLFLPAGLNQPQSKVEAMREKQQAMQMRQQAMTEMIPAMAGAAKDLGLTNKPK
jgi:outer membrane murein-binding lipoprotein Lpp